MGLPRPYYQEGTDDDPDRIVIYHGDCREILPELAGVDLLLSDPPWGNQTACNAQRFTRARSPWWSNVDTSKIVAHENIQGDNEPFDPRPLLAMQKPTILWGANHFADKLPPSGGWLVWDKRKNAEQLAEKGWPLGEAELAWTNVIGATRVYRNLWSGLLRSSEKGEFYHPTQKPIALMGWCLRFATGRVCDPYMGSGPTLLAAKEDNRSAIGIEIVEAFCEITAKRLAQGVLEFTDPQPPDGSEG